MIGTILSFDPLHGGLLRGEDGRRYPFPADAWQGAKPPAPGTMVDFERDGDSACELYPLGGEAGAGSGAAAWLAARPGAPLALLMLAACFLPFLTLGPASANMFNIVGVASALGDYAPVTVNMEAGLWLFHFLYIVPAAAMVLLVLEWAGRAGRWLRIGTGVIGLAAPIAIALGARALFTPAAPNPDLSLGTRVLRRVGEYVAPDLFVPHVGPGWIALGLLSLALVLVGIFWRERDSAAPGEPS